MGDALGVNERDVLMSIHDEPHDEVGVQIATLEQADTIASAAVAQQVQLLILKEVGVIIIVTPEVLHKLPLAPVQSHWRYGHSTPTQTEQRLVQVPLKVRGDLAVLGPFDAGKPSLCNGCVELIQPLNDLLLVRVDVYAVLAHEVRVVCLKRQERCLLGFPSILVERVEALAVFGQQSRGNLLPHRDTLKGAKCKVVGLDEQRVPPVLFQQSPLGTAWQRQIEPALLVLELLQRIVELVPVEKAQLLCAQFACGQLHGICRRTGPSADARLHAWIPAELNRSLTQVAVQYAVVGQSEDW